MIYDVNGTPIVTEGGGDQREELYLGEIVQGYCLEDGVGSSQNRICMKNALALPYGAKTKLTVSMNPDYKITMRVGASPYSLSSNLYFFTNNNTITLPSSANYYRVGIAKQDGESNITVDELATINLHIYYEPHETGFEPFDSVANAVMEKVGSGSSNMNYRTLPTFIHTSDVHGDYVRVKRFAKFGERLGITMACITGDITAFNIHTNSNHFEWFHEIVKGSNISWGVCVGNHDCHVGSGSSAYTMADDDFYPIFYSPIAEDIGNETGKLWYVKDLSSAKIRIISLDLYQEGGSWTYSHISETQLAWLCSTLADTPQDYGVIILMHAQQKSVTKDNDHAKFFQTVRKGDSAEHYNPYTGDADPIGDIVNAFIGKSTISSTYTEGQDTLTVSGDFTSLASGVEFICYMTGHFHQDTIGYNPRPSGDPKQLVLNVTCGCSVYGGSSYKYLADVSDIPRNQKDSTQDAFNVYGIDRENKQIRVARIGSNLNSAFEARDFMVIPYAD